MSVNRLFQIVNILLTKKTVTATDLSKEFDVSVRTIYRDIDDLSIAGIPVYTTQGRDGGIALLDNHVLYKSVFSSVEQEQIIMALKNISTTSPDINSLLIKMRALFRKPDIDWMEIDLSRWGNGAQDTEKFNLFRTGILQKRIVTFKYVNAYGKKSIKTTKPVKLSFKAKAWYLQAFCTTAQDYRTYKLNRISNVILKRKNFTETLSAPPIEDYLKCDLVAKITLKFDKCIAHRVYEEFDDSNITVDNDENLIATMRMPEDNWLYGYLLSFGSALEVLEPPHIRQILAEQAEGILNAYNDAH